MTASILMRKSSPIELLNSIALYVNLLLEVDMEFKISTYRKALNLTQVELASILGVSFQTISKWENGVAIPDIYMLTRLADIFEVTLDDLVNRKPKVKLRKDKSDYWGRHIDYLFDTRKNLWNDDYFEFLVTRVWQFDKPMKILDFGCGYGYLGLKLMPLLPEGSLYVGIDANEDLIEKGRLIFKASDYKYQFIHADIYDYTFDEAYDLCICQALIRHSHKPFKILEQMVSATKKGGKVICIDVNRVTEVIGYHNSAINYNPMVSLNRFLKNWDLEINQGGRDYASGLKIPSYLKRLGLENIDSRVNDKLEVITSQEEIRAFMKIFNWPTENIEEKFTDLRTYLKKDKLSEAVIDDYLKWHEENIRSLLNPNIEKMITFSRGLIVSYGDKT